jgi:hypothetical protein
MLPDEVQWWRVGEDEAEAEARPKSAISDRWPVVNIHDMRGARSRQRAADEVTMTRYLATSSFFLLPLCSARVAQYSDSQRDQSEMAAQRQSTTNAPPAIAESRGDNALLGPVRSATLEIELVLGRLQEAIAAMEAFMEDSPECVALIAARDGQVASLNALLQRLEALEPSEGHVSTATAA